MWPNREVWICYEDFAVFIADSEGTREEEKEEEKEEEEAGEEEEEEGRGGKGHFVVSTNIRPLLSLKNRHQSN